ncbi:MAG: DUF2156 domain-containing protein [Clostridia bacterium]|nr:DUF2156 domain-containing protein [Clostridia bacterium]
MIFKDVKVEDKDIIDKYLQADGKIMADRCFATLCIWQEVYLTKYCIVDDMLVVKYENEGYGIYTVPMGDGDFEGVLKKIIAHAEQCDSKYKIIDITPEKLEFFKSCCDLQITYARWSCDYIYDTESMISLAGKKLHAKRNLVNRFKADYEGRWEYRQINFADDRKLIFEYLEKFKEKNGADDEAYREELLAITRAFDYSEFLEIYGGMILIDGEICAFTIGAPQNENAMDILFEKAYFDIKGAYQIIFNEFCINSCRGYKYINREEDLGIEGLRKSKLSYNPLFLTDKYEANCRA